MTRDTEYHNLVRAFEQDKVAMIVTSNHMTQAEAQLLCEGLNYSCIVTGDYYIFYKM